MIDMERMPDFMQEKQKKVYAVPLCAALLAPLTVYGQLIDTGLSGFTWFSGQEKVFDFFLYGKRNVIIAVSCLMLVFGAALFLKGGFRRKLKKMLLIFGPLLIYVCLAIASSVISPYREFAWKGMMEQQENVFIIVGYLVICVYAYMACCGEAFTALGIFCCTIGGIGTLQLFGADLYRTQLAQRLFMPKALQGLAFEITAETGRSYCSLSNPNYVGMLCCLTLPVLILLAMCAGTRRRRALYGTASALMLLSLFGSRSKSGIVVFSVCMVLMAVLFRNRIAAGLKLRQRTVDALLAFLLFFMCAAVCVLVYRWGELWSYDDHAETGISEITTMDDGVKIVYRGKKLMFKMNDGGVTLSEAVCVVDENGQAYDMLEKEGTLYFAEKKLSKLTAAIVQYGDYIALEFWDGSFYWYFTNQADGHTWHYLTRFGKPVKLDSSAIAVCKWLEGKERVANGRGYIWSRTLPLVKNHIFLGSGQDSFTIVFPNYDYLGKARWGYKDMLITKPHCMYMQIAVQSGLISVIALFVFWGRFLIKGFSTNAKSMNGALLKAIAIGVTGYLLMGLTNDSNIGVAPVFWILVGMGLRMC